MSDAVVKRPNDIVHSVFDLRPFAALVVPAAVTYTLRCEAGIGVEDVTTTPNLIDLLLTGGSAGRVCELGIEAFTDDGRSVVMRRLVRVRDADQINGAMGVGDAPGQIYLDDVGAILLDGAPILLSQGAA